MQIKHAAIEFLRSPLKSRNKLFCSPLFRNRKSSLNPANEIAPNQKNKACICLYFLLCSIFPGERNWGLGIGDWVLRTGHRALALGTGHWALGRGVWGLVVGHCIGHCRLAHGRHQAKAIKATYREVSDEPVWRQTYKSPILFS